MAKRMISLMLVVFWTMAPGEAAGQSEVKKLTGASGRFGQGVAIDGEIAVVSASCADVGIQDGAGTAYIYGRSERDPNNWGEVKQLIASDFFQSDSFGVSVSVSGDIVIIGAPSNDDAGFNSGSAYIFARNQGGLGNWEEVTKLTASDAAAEHQFGNCVSVSGDIAVVGAPAGIGSTGAAYVFARNQGGPDNWGEVKRLTPSDGASNDQFGRAVGVSGDTVVVGANGSGAAYVFGRNQGGVNNWGELTILVPSGPPQDDQFGHSAFIDHETIIIAAPSNNDLGFHAGAAYIFARNKGGVDNWGEVKKLLAPDGEELDNFGTTPSVSGDIAIVGAIWDDDNGTDAGAVYVYERDFGGTDNWGFVVKFAA